MILWCAPSVICQLAMCCADDLLVELLVYWEESPLTCACPWRKQVRHDMSISWESAPTVKGHSCQQKTVSFSIMSCVWVHVYVPRRQLARCVVLSFRSAAGRSSRLGHTHCTCLCLLQGRGPLTQGRCMWIVATHDRNLEGWQMTTAAGALLFGASVRWFLG